jgi:hypothetical protein
MVDEFETKVTTSRRSEQLLNLFRCRWRRYEQIATRNSQQEPGASQQRGNKQKELWLAIDGPQSGDMAAGTLTLSWRAGRKSSELTTKLEAVQLSSRARGSAAMEKAMLAKKIDDGDREVSSINHSCTAHRRL